MRRHGYSGQSPERLKLHMLHQADFDPSTLTAADGPAKGDYYGLPWPCWGTPDLKHPGSLFLYDTGVPVMRGRQRLPRPLGRRAQGRDAARRGFMAGGSEITGGYPEFTMAVLKKLGWDKELTADEMVVIKKMRDMPGGANIDLVSWQTDLSGGIQRVALKHGCAPFGNGKARAVAWNLRRPGADPPRADLHPAPRPHRPIPALRRPPRLPPAAARPQHPGRRSSPRTSR